MRTRRCVVRIVAAHTTSVDNIIIHPGARVTGSRKHQLIRQWPRPYFFLWMILIKHCDNRLSSAIRTIFYPELDPVDYQQIWRKLIIRGSSRDPAVSGAIRWFRSGCSAYSVSNVAIWKKTSWCSIDMLILHVYVLFRFNKFMCDIVPVHFHQIIFMCEVLLMFNNCTAILVALRVCISMCLTSALFFMGIQHFAKQRYGHLIT